MTASPQLWVLDRLDSLAGIPVTITGTPHLTDSPYGTATAFDGAGDSLTLNTNPVYGLARFTVEVTFRPDAEGSAEQRFLHMGEQSGDRLLFETRLTADYHWYLDTFICAAGDSCTLLNRNFHHPVGQWYHLAMTCDGTEQVNYVDGLRERQGAIQYSPANGGRTSIGVRLNHVCWFKGAIRQVRITPQVLSPDQFLPH